MGIRSNTNESLGEWISNLLSHPKFSWTILGDYLFILLGALIQALAMRLFLVPGQLVSGGISGIAQIINHFTGWPIGLMVFVGNIPLFLLGWRFLGGSRFAMRTAVSIVTFSIFTDLLVLFIPKQGITQDPMLNALFGGVVLGFGLGLVYRGRGTSGGSDIIGRILNRKTGISISQSYLVTDTISVLGGGFAFSWELALYGMVVIYISGLAAEMTSEGSNIFRATMIITGQPEEISQKILTVLERGVTVLSGTGAYTHEERPVLYCVVTRAEVSQLKALVFESDPGAFMVVGQVHEALGLGFQAPDRSL